MALPVDAAGSINRTVPSEISSENPEMRILAGDWIKWLGNMVAPFAAGIKKY
jgi:hypothetical protein